MKKSLLSQNKMKIYEGLSQRPARLKLWMKFRLPRPGLLGIAILELVLGCAVKQIPEQPQLIYYGIYSGLKRPGFFAVDPLTNLPLYLPFDSADMVGGQCLSPGQFQMQQSYILTLKTMILGD